MRISVLTLSECFHYVVYTNQTVHCSLHLYFQISSGHSELANHMTNTDVHDLEVCVRVPNDAVSYCVGRIFWIFVVENVVIADYQPPVLPTSEQTLDVSCQYTVICSALGLFFALKLHVLVIPAFAKWNADAPKVHYRFEFVRSGVIR